MKPAIVILSTNAVPLAQRVAAAIDGEVHGLARRVEGVDVPFEDTGAHFAALYRAGRPIVAVMASGAIIRLLAPHLSDKHGEPPVVTVSEDGASVVPLLLSRDPSLIGALTSSDYTATSHPIQKSQY